MRLGDAVGSCEGDAGLRSLLVSGALLRRASSSSSPYRTPLWSWSSSCPLASYSATVSTLLSRSSPLDVMRLLLLLLPPVPCWCWCCCWRRLLLRILCSPANGLRLTPLLARCLPGAEATASSSIVCLICSVTECAYCAAMCSRVRLLDVRLPFNGRVRQTGWLHVEERKRRGLLLFVLVCVLECPRMRRDRPVAAEVLAHSFSALEV